jgi:hypothetical protein
MIPEIIDQALHLIWFFALACLVWNKDMGLARCLLIASLLVLPREFIDQWHGWSIGIGKLTDIFSCYLGAFSGWLYRSFLILKGD